jgi:hypothetical protein
LKDYKEGRLRAVESAEEAIEDLKGLSTYRMRMWSFLEINLF